MSINHLCGKTLGESSSPSRTEKRTWSTATDKTAFKGPLIVLDTEDGQHVMLYPNEGLDLSELGTPVTNFGRLVYFNWLQTRGRNLDMKTSEPSSLNGSSFSGLLEGQEGWDGQGFVAGRTLSEEKDEAEKLRIEGQNQRDLNEPKRETPSRVIRRKVEKTSSSFPRGSIGEWADRIEARCSLLLRTEIIVLLSSKQMWPQEVATLCTWLQERREKRRDEAHDEFCHRAWERWNQRVCARGHLYPEACDGGCQRVDKEQTLGTRAEASHKKPKKNVKRWVTPRGELSSSEILPEDHIYGPANQPARAYLTSRAASLRKAASAWRRSYSSDFESASKPPGVLTSIPPGEPIQAEPPLLARLLPRSVRLFIGAPAVKGPVLHRAILLGQLYEALRAVLLQYGYRVRSDLAERINTSAPTDCQKVKGWISLCLNFPMSLCLGNPDGDVDEMFWHKRELQFCTRKFSNGRCKKSSVSLSFSILMIKKYFGSLCSCTVPSFVEGCVSRLTREPRKLSPVAFAAIDQAVDELVTPSFFRNYEKFCSGIALPNRSYLGLPRSSGGLHDLIVDDECVLEGRRTREHQDFIDTLTQKPTGKWTSIIERYLCEDTDSTVEIRLVGGPLKNRAVTINDAAHFCLKGLQLCLHKGLKKDLRFQFIGKPINASDLGSMDGLLVSGDYEAATDNFSSEMTRHAWARIETKMAGRVPEHILRIARKSLDPQLVYDGKDFHRQTSGQLMGQLLSFPLLCIINYAAFRLTHPRDVPLRINGDDILFGARDQDRVDDWFEGVTKIGLVASKGKTYVHDHVCTMNSEVFYKVDKHFVRVPFLHSGYLRIEEEAAPSLSWYVRSFATSMATKMANFFIDWHSLWDDVPVFGHPTRGAKGGVLTGNLDFAKICKGRDTRKVWAASRLARGGNPLRCSRRTDKLFSQFIKFERNVAACDREQLTQERAQLEVLRSWSGKYDLGRPTRDLSNYGILKSQLDTIFWQDGEASDGYVRPYMPQITIPSARQRILDLEEFAQLPGKVRLLRVDWQSLEDEFQQ